MNNVQEKIEIHDRYQFEIKYTYPLNQELPETDYLVETFIFIPNNLGVNADSYTKHDFYSDLQKYIRFKTPVFPIRLDWGYGLNQREGKVPGQFYFTMGQVF